MSQLPSPNPGTIAALERVIEGIRYLVDHPRIQQRTWVASGKQWLPLLQIVHAELTGRSAPIAAITLPQGEEPMLIKVSMRAAETYVQIRLEEIERIEINRMRGFSSVTLKSSQQYVLTADEAQRIVDAMRKRDES